MKTTICPIIYNANIIKYQNVPPSKGNDFEDSYCLKERCALWVKEIDENPDGGKDTITGHCGLVKY